MVIANPIYDVVFKRMMENDKVAKFFIGTLLEQTIESVEVKPQEFTYTNELAGISVFRLDFLATIKTETGALKKILIEIQKAKNQIDLMRFRNYLAEQYKKEDIVNNENQILPITTIYILGFDLPEIDSPCLHVERNYKDLIKKEKINTKSDFVEKLTHDSYVVQVAKITNRYQTKLDKLLSVFEQSNFVDKSKIVKEFTHETDIDEVKIITEILHHSGTNPAEKKKIEIEQEAWRTVDAMTEDLRGKLENQIKLNDKIEKELSEKENVLSEKENELNQKENELSEKQKELIEKDKLIEALMKKLNQK